VRLPAINGWIMTAAAYLKKNPGRATPRCRDAARGLKCRCGTARVSILAAIKRLKRRMA